MATRCLSRTGAKFMFWTCCAILIASVALLLVFPNIYKNKLTAETTLTEGSMLSNIWKDIPLPLYEKLYFFNITNAEDFLKHGAPLNVTQVGPYTYNGKWTKDHPQWNGNGTVSYRERRTYQFIRHLSHGSQDESIYTLNGPMIIAADILRHYNIFVRIASAAFLGIEKEKLITKKRIRELVYDGYEDPIIKLAPILKPDIPFKHGIFSWLYGKNNSDDGLFTIFTGEGNSTQTGLLETWNGVEYLNFWKDDTCNKIEGTSLEVGPPLPKHPLNYTFFQSIFCRTLSLDYAGEAEHFGITTKRFVTTDQIFANSTENPNNKCFEIDGERPSGVLDVRPCQFGAPVFLSFPHFHMSDPSYLNNIEGLHPNAEDHGSYVDVEPTTGISLDASVKFQVNIELKRVRGILQFDNVPEGVFPVFWAALEIHVNDKWASFLKRQLYLPKILVYTLVGGLMVISFGLLVWSMVVLRRAAQEDEDPLLVVKEQHKEDLPKKMLSTTAEDRPEVRADKMQGSSSFENSFHDQPRAQSYSGDTITTYPEVINKANVNLPHET